MDILGFISENPETIGIPLAIIIVGLLFYKAGILKGFGDWLKAKSDKMSNNGNRTNERLKTLEKFAKKAETNHYTDLEDVIDEVHSLRKEFIGFRERLAILETKVGTLMKK